MGGVLEVGYKKDGQELYGRSYEGWELSDSIVHQTNFHIGIILATNTTNPPTAAPANIVSSNCAQFKTMTCLVLWEELS